MPIIKAVIIGMIIGLLIEKLILKIKKKNLPAEKQARRPKISHLFIAWIAIFVFSKVMAFLK